MSIPTSLLCRGLAVSVTLVAAIATLAARQPARTPSLPDAARQATAGYNAGPIAISMRQASEAMVLQADGRVFALDTARGAIGSQFYRVPSGYQAVDLSAGTVPAGPIVCFTLNKSSSKDYGSYVLQVLANRKETWNLLMPG